MIFSPLAFSLSQNWRVFGVIPPKRRKNGPVPWGSDAGPLVRYKYLSFDGITKICHFVEFSKLPRRGSLSRAGAVGRLHCLHFARVQGLRVGWCPELVPAPGAWCLKTPITPTALRAHAERVRKFRKFCARGSASRCRSVYRCKIIVKSLLRGHFRAFSPAVGRLYR